MTSRGNRGRATTATDTALTPPFILEKLGPFYLDPCCPPVMPWRTAQTMVYYPADGLELEWTGRVWVNPPFSRPYPWIKKMAEHGDGIMLLPAKSPETRWGQLLLRTADLLWYYAGRFPFHRPDGTVMDGTWHPIVFAAYGPLNVQVLLDAKFPGIPMQRFASDYR